MKQEKFLFVVNINLNKGQVKFQVNFQYEIVKTQGDLFTLSNITTGEEQHVGDRIIKYSLC